MIEDPIHPVLENPRVDMCFGLHLNNFSPSGIIISQTGAMTANSDRIFIDIKG